MPDLTDKEKEVLRALNRCKGDLMKASMLLGKDERTIQNTLSRVRRKLRESQRTVNTLVRYKNLKRVLFRRRR